MTQTLTGRWEELRESIIGTPELREHYEHTKQSVMQTRRLLQQIDAERERVGLSKADLAHRIGADPSVVRRMFSAEASNPQLRTVLGMMDALGLDFTVKRGRRAGRGTRAASQPSSQRASTAD
jgi:ribosome-binding protein aMBF1 (putative translation factor)